jgi:hypothetical protein
LGDPSVDVRRSGASTQLSRLEEIRSPGSSSPAYPPFDRSLGGVSSHRVKKRPGRGSQPGRAASFVVHSHADADPAAVKAAGDLRQTMFLGDTLRGMLLNAYAFGTLGTIAIYAAIASFIDAAAMAVLSLLGWRHLLRAPAEEEGPPGGRQPAPAPA